MITIISGTNRAKSECLRFANKYADLLKEKTDQTVQVLALEAIPHDWFHPDMYAKGQQTKSLTQLQDQYVIPVQKFVFVLPEYNGGVPGALKLFIDGCSVRNYSENFAGKKAALVGIATGRAGNLRGMDHLTGVLNHLGVVVLPNKLPISQIKKLMDTDGEIKDEDTIKAMQKQIDQFLAL